MDSILYFSYGSNTNKERMQRRCSSAFFMGVGLLPNYKMVMKHYCDIVKDPSTNCYGAIWGLEISDIEKLDRYEGLGNHYRHEIVDVIYNDERYKCLTYVMLPHKGEYDPADHDYINIVIKGYKDVGIPLAQLQNSLKNQR
jgi:Gamma-glutamyl cyclotransferase, AIG2-like